MANKIIIDRNIEMVTNYVCGYHLTYQTLADKYGITRERVRQILNKHLEPHQLKEIKKVNSRKRSAIVMRKNIKGKCKNCGGEKLKSRMFCSKECNFKYKSVTEEHKKEVHSMAMKRYYKKNKKRMNLSDRIYYYKKKIENCHDSEKVDEYTKILNNLIAEKRQIEK